MWVGTMSGRERMPSDETSQAASGAQGDELERLRALLAAPERARLQSVEARLDARLVDADGVAQVLPQAVRACVESGDVLAQALTPAVQSALVESVRRDPAVLANALAPTIGAAIRKAIATAISGMLDGFNRTLEHSLSPRSLRWRLESWRTQRPFAEVVMLHTLKYKVEQVFLIHRATGLLLQHSVAPTIASADPELVSSMLSAIASFVAESFSAERDTQLEEIEFGDRRVVLARGPAAVLAAVTRGFPPKTWREQLQESIEAVHSDFADDLAHFDGDAAPFASAAPKLELLLVEQRAQTPPSRLLAVLALVLLAVLIVLGGLGVRSAVNAHSLSQAVERVRTAFEGEPGYVLVEVRAADGQVKLVALRSPEARAPQSVLQSAEVGAFRVDMRVVDVALAPEAKR